jgi:IS5 family transposase
MEKNYTRVEELGDKLAEIDPLIDWEVFRPIIREMYDNHTEHGGRHNNDEDVGFTIVVWFVGSKYGSIDTGITAAV